MKSRSGSLSTLIDARHEISRERVKRGETVRAVVTTRGRTDRALASTDIVEWGEENFYLPTGGKIMFAPHQKCILRYAFTRQADAHFIASTIIYSTIKKSGKSTVAGVVARWFAETQTRYGEIDAVGNDAKQAKERSFAEIRKSLEQTPGYQPGPRLLPARWRVLEQTLRCLTTGSFIAALALDARGEAGGAPALTIWTELWGLESEAGKRFWDELTPVPTLPDSIRYVETYAGYEGESELLYGLYVKGQEGRQLTAHDLAVAGSLNRHADGSRVSDDWPYAQGDVRAGEAYEDLLNAFVEAGGEGDALVPIWVDENAGMLMYWDEGDVARRMPWQLGDEGDRYYREQASGLKPQAYDRLHRNYWTTSESAFVPIERWDACYDPNLPPLDPDTPIVISCDAAVSKDCFGIVAVSRHPQRHDDPAVRACRVWTPPKSGEGIDFDEPEAFLRFLMTGGCALGHPDPSESFNPAKLREARAECPACRDGIRIPKHNVVQVCYDPYQLENMMGRFRREQLGWIKAFPQGQDRLVADSQLASVIMNGRLAHGENPREDDGREKLHDQTPMRTHLRNANAKIQKNEDSKVRIVKKAEYLKIDLAVAMSQGVARILKLIV